MNLNPSPLASERCGSLKVGNQNFLLFDKKIDYN